MAHDLATALAIGIPQSQQARACRVVGCFVRSLDQAEVFPANDAVEFDRTHAG